MIEQVLHDIVLFGVNKLESDYEDRIYLYNLLLGHFQCKNPVIFDSFPDNSESITDPKILEDRLLDELNQLGYDSALAAREVAFAFGVVTARPSLLQEKFDRLYAKSPLEATEWLYRVSVDSDYVRKEEIAKNIVFSRPTSFGEIEISINLSKPEKKNSDIAKLLSKPISSEYPPCAICLDNLGYFGDDRHAARTNLRFVKIPLDGEEWYLQFSPYGYFKRHCILIQREHVQMEVSKRIFDRLLSFLDLFPHYFIGSNADLPIVGGSILNHEHFQGGEHLLPVMKTKFSEAIFKMGEATLHHVDFPVTCLAVKGRKKEDVVALADKVRCGWNVYDDPKRNILHGEGEVRHNTVTTLARKVDGEYIVYLMLRNNKTSPELPDGLYHVHPDKSHIKSEGIGLIEAGGLFILPARLKRQGDQVKDIIASGYSDEEAVEKHPDMVPFLPMIHQMKKNKQSLEDYLANVCENILIDVAVFKPDDDGRAGLRQFLEVNGLCY